MQIGWRIWAELGWAELIRTSSNSRCWTSCKDKFRPLPFSSLSRYLSQQTRMTLSQTNICCQDWLIHALCLSLSLSQRMKSGSLSFVRKREAKRWSQLLRPPSSMFLLLLSLLLLQLLHMARAETAQERRGEIQLEFLFDFFIVSIKISPTS